MRLCLRALLLLPALFACNGVDVERDRASPLGAWEAVWWDGEPLPVRQRILFGEWDGGCYSPIPGKFKCDVLTLDVRLDELALEPADTAGSVFDDYIVFTEEKVRYACILPWSPRQLAEQQLMGPRSVHGYLRGEGAFETGPVEFDALGDPTELRCEVDGADHLECQQVYPYDDTTGRTIRFRRRASLESTRQPLLCDKLFERFLISGGIL
jgi:hypothetical protein